MEGFWILLFLFMVGYELLEKFPILIVIPFLAFFILAGKGIVW